MKRDALNATSVDVIYGAYGAISGNSIDMLGTPGPGSISQTLATTVGQSYLVSELLSRSERGTAPKHARAT